MLALCLKEVFELKRDTREKQVGGRKAKRKTKILQI